MTKTDAIGLLILHARSEGMEPTYEDIQMLHREWHGELSRRAALIARSTYYQTLEALDYGGKQQ